MRIKSGISEKKEEKDTFLLAFGIKEKMPLGPYWAQVTKTLEVACCSENPLT